jgi:ubiquinone biosynthesis protein UbiJ
MIEAVRTRTRSRTKSLSVAARAPTRRAKRRQRKRCTYLEVVSQISAVCRYDEKTKIPSNLDAAEIDAAIATVKEAVGELKKMLDKLEEARSHK